MSPFLDDVQDDEPDDTETGESCRLCDRPRRVWSSWRALCGWCQRKLARAEPIA